MLFIKFGGWVSCRLATAPDPFDDPRGNLSGFSQFAFAGEPDLDRIIRFQKPPFHRSYGPPIGVTVKSVHKDTQELSGHGLIGAEVDLLDNPVFEGRNWVITFDTQEPVCPFHLQLHSSGRAVSRPFMPKNAAYPFSEMLPLGSSGVTPEEVMAATGVSKIATVWAGRLASLKNDLQTADEHDKPGLEERIAILQSGRMPAGVFFFCMRWNYVLNGSVTGDAQTLLGMPVNVQMPWGANFWFGGFDADAQSFYCAGTLSVPENQNDTVPVASIMRSARRLPRRSS